MITTLVVIAAVLYFTARRRKRRDPVNPTRSRGRVASLAIVAALLGIQALVGSPAMAQQQATSCAPFPERPGTGMVGAVDPPQGHGLSGGPYTNEQFPNSPYLDYGYAGMVWHVYDPNCERPVSITDPSVTIDTWLGNELFDIGKNIVGATNSLHYTLYNGGVLGGLNKQIGDAANAIFDNIYMQLFSIFMLILAILMFRQIWKGDLAAVSRRGLFALGGMWLAASTLVLVTNYDAFDRLIVETTTGIQNGFQNPEDDRIQRDVLPTELHTKVVYENWLRGEFDSVDGPEVEEFGRRLLDAQAWRWEDLATAGDASNQTEADKRADYEKIYTELESSQGTFSGTQGSRTGSGFLAFLQALFYSLFQFFAKLAVLLAQLLLRIFTLAAPVIGLVALVHHDILRKVGRAVGGVVLNVLILAMLAGIHFRFLELIFDPSVKLTMLTQMLLAGIVTLVFLLVGRPMKRMWQMVELSVGAVGATVPTAGGLFSRFRRRKGADQRGPQDEFWDNLRDEELAGDTVATTRNGRRSRPEAAGPIMATAERLDTRRQALGTGAFGLPSAGGDAQPVLMPSGPGGRNDPAGAIPPRRSRVVDTSPVYGEFGEDAMVVPSQVNTRRNEGRFDAPPIPRPASPRPADVEMVAGRPVHVVYRPSRGLEVREPRRMPLQDGPRGTDAAVR